MDDNQIPERFRLPDEPTPVVLQPRDYDLLKFLFDHGYASSKMLWASTLPQLKYLPVQQRLNQLWGARYILRPDAQAGNIKGRAASLVYQLADDGLEALFREKLITREDVRWRSTLMKAKRTEFWHDLSLGNATGSIRLGLPKDSYLTAIDIMRLAPAETQESKDPFTFHLPNEHRITPDDVFAIKSERNGKPHYTRYLLENDMQTESLTRTTAGSSFEWKLECYDTLLSREDIEDQLGIKAPPYIAIMTPSQARIDNIKAKTAKLKNRKQFIFGVLPYFTKFDRVPNPEPTLAATPWQRLGYPDFNIIEGR